MAVTLVLNLQEGLLRQTGEEVHDGIVHYIDLTSDDVTQEIRTHKDSEFLAGVSQLQRGERNDAEQIIVGSQKIYRRRLENRISTQPRNYLRERSRSNTRRKSRGRSRGHSRSKSRGNSGGRSRGHSRNRSRENSRGRSRGHSRNRSRGNSRDRCEGHSGDRYRGNAKGQCHTKECSNKKNLNHCRCQKKNYLPRNTASEENCNYAHHEKRKSI